MAKIPTAADLPQVAAAPQRVVRVSPRNFGSDVATATQEFAGAVGQVSDRFGGLYAETDAKEADAVLSKRIRERLFGDGTDENPGYYNTRGNDAIDGQEEVDKDIETYREEAMEGLSTRAKRLFQTTADRRAGTALTGTSSHVLNRRKELEASTSVAREENAYQDVLREQ